jgi:hypothetical protein
MTDQPEALALRLADLMAERVKPRVLHATGQTQQPAGFRPDRECVAAALLLREQHAHIEDLISRNQGLAMQNSLLRATVEAMKRTEAIKLEDKT